MYRPLRYLPVRLIRRSSFTGQPVCRGVDVGGDVDVDVDVYVMER